MVIIFFFLQKPHQTRVREFSMYVLIHVWRGSLRFKKVSVQCDSAQPPSSGPAKTVLSALLYQRCCGFNPLPMGTADMDKCKLLTWCCLLCSLIKDSVALLSHNLPPNMLKVSATETPFLFSRLMLSVFPHTELMHVMITKQLFMTCSLCDLPLSNEFIW